MLGLSTSNGPVLIRSQALLPVVDVRRCYAAARELSLGSLSGLVALASKGLLSLHIAHKIRARRRATPTIALRLNSCRALRATPHVFNGVSGAVTLVTDIAAS